MNFEGPGDVPAEQPPERRTPADGGFEGMTSDEIPLTPSDRPATTHVPEFSPLAGESAAEESAEPFGVARFHDTNLQFDGRPPTDYLEATTGRLEALMWGEHGALQVYEPFRDATARIPTGEESSVEPAIELETRLEYTDVHGRADVTIAMDSVDVHFIGVDGCTSFARYYTQAGEATDGQHPEYETLRKDTHDPYSGLPPTGDDTPESVQRAWYASARHARQLDDGTADRPLVSSEEAAYVFDHVIPRAQPLTRTIDNLMDTIRREHVAVQAGYEMPPALQRLAAHTYAKHVDIYESLVAEPEAPVALDHHRTGEVFNTDHTATVVRTRTFNLEFEGMKMPLAPEIEVGHLEDLSTATQDEIGQALQRYGLEMPPDGDVAVIVSRLAFGQHTDHIACGLASEVRNSQGFRYPPVIHYFTATTPVLHDLRNYLLLGTRGDRPGGGPPIVWTPS